MNKAQDHYITSGAFVSNKSNHAVGIQRIQAKVVVHTPPKDLGYSQAQCNRIHEINLELDSKQVS